MCSYFLRQLLAALPCILIGASTGNPAFAAAPSGDGTAPGEFRIAAPDKVCCHVRRGARRIWTTPRQCKRVGGRLVSNDHCKERYCYDYANAAVEANQTNERNNCGFSGPRWSADFGHHRDWCRKVSFSQSRNETRARDRQLASCKGKMRYCRAYADSAILANRTNKRKGCGFTGPRWRSDFGHHYDWCMKVSRTKSRSEIRARRDQLLKKCG